MREINFARGSVKLGSDWKEIDLIVPLGEHGRAFIKLGPLQERIFEALHVRAHIEHPICFEHVLEMYVSCALVFSKRAEVFTPEVGGALPCNISPIHLGGTEDLDLRGPPFATIVLYGFFKDIR